MARTALLVIDVQIALVDGAWKIDEVLENIEELQRRARESGAPIVFVQHNHVRYEPMMKGAATWSIDPRVAPLPGEVVVEKTASDGFFESELQSELERLGVNRVVVTGMQTEFCVDATCRAALSRGFKVALAADAHTTSEAITPAETTIRHHNYALANLAHPYHSIEVIPSAEIGFT